MRGRRGWQSTCLSWLGVPYLLTGSDRSGTDCVGFVVGALNEYGYPSLDRTLTSILAPPGWRAVPLPVAQRDGFGILLWGWKNIKMTNVDSWSVSWKRKSDDSVLYSATGNDSDYTSSLQSMYNAYSARADDSRTMANLIWEMRERSIDVLQIADSPGKTRALSWMKEGVYYPFRQAFHHIAVILDRRNIIHSTITSQASGVQLTPLGSALAGDTGFDSATVNAFSGLFGIGVNLVTSSSHVLTNMTWHFEEDDTFHSPSGSYAAYREVDLQADFVAETGIIPAVLDREWLARFSNLIGPLESDARAAYYAGVGSRFAAGTPADDAFFV